MERRIVRAAVVMAAAAFLLALSGCATLSVQAPPGMFVSTGDYVPGIRTMGIIQESKTVIAFLFVFDLNSVYQDLYNQLIQKGQAVGADGITNIRFTWKPSPWTYLTLPIATGVFDFYIEGVAIKKG